jgi:hypothetical protein
MTSCSLYDESLMMVMKKYRLDLRFLLAYGNIDDDELDF